MTGIRQVLHHASYAIGRAFLVPSENQQLRSVGADGIRVERAGTNECEGGKQRCVLGGESRPIAWRPRREVRLVNAQVLEQLENAFLDREFDLRSSFSLLPSSRYRGRQVQRLLGVVQLDAEAFEDVAGQGPGQSALAIIPLM
jgi:hypothetical protein